MPGKEDSMTTKFEQLPNYTKEFEAQQKRRTGGSMLKNPWQIYCREHGVQPKYLVCDHVVRGEHASYLFRAIETDAGYALCADCSDCIKAGNPNDSAVRDVCVFHANRMLGGSLNEMLNAREREAKEKMAATK